MWTRKELKDKAKATIKLNYWKSVLVALVLALVTGGTAAISASSGAGAGSRTVQRYTLEPGSQVVVTETMTDEEIDAFLNDVDYDLADPDIPAEELIEQVGIDNDDAPARELDPGIFIAAGITFTAVFLVALAIIIAIDAFLLNPVAVGTRRFSIRNLNTKAEAKEVAYAFDSSNYKEIVKTMILRDVFTCLWGLLFIIPGIVKAYEYRMIPYLLADDPTMTKDRAFAESRAMMSGNKWRAFVLDLSFLGWNILSLLTLGILGTFYVDPYKLMTDAALYESLRYGTPAPEFAAAGAYAEQVPVPPFAAEEGFAPENPEA